MIVKRIEHYLTEARAVDDMAVLRDCVDVVVRSLPWKFEASATEMLPGHLLNGITALVKKYAGTRYAEAVEAIKQHTFYFINDDVAHKMAGMYFARPHMEFRFYISVFLGEHRAVRSAELLAYRGTSSLKTFRALLLHELRHMFQAYSYPTYFYSKREVPYRKAPVEIDAAWQHHLQDFDVEDYATAADYTRAVMQDFAAYKTLTPEQIVHYRRKTAAYWDQTRNAGRDPLTDSIQDRLQIRRRRVANQLLYKLGKIKHDIDMRALPGYDPDASMFFLPERVVRSVSATISADKVVATNAAPLVFVTLALVRPDNVAEALRHLRAVQKITPADALAHLDATFKGGWDTQALRRAIQDVFM